MSAIPEEFLSKTAKVNDASVKAFPNSKKITIKGSRDDIRVPMREIALTELSDAEDDADQQRSVLVYDTSGPYTDPDVNIDIRAGLQGIRKAWIDERGDTEGLQEQTSLYGKKRAADLNLDHLRF